MNIVEILFSHVTLNNNISMDQLLDKAMLSISAVVY